MSDGEDKLLAIFPLCSRKLLWLNIYEFIGSDRSDYLDIITSAPRETVLRVALEYLLKHGKRPHIINLENLYLEKEQVEDIKRSATASGVASDHRTAVRCPYIKINSNWEDFLKNRGNVFRKKVSKKEKRLMGKGDIEVILVREFNSNDKRIGNVFEVAKKIEQESWKFKQGSPRILTSKLSEKFYSEFLDRFSQNGWLDSWFAIFQGVPVAYAFNINYGQKIFAYNAAYDGRYKEYGLGALLHIKRIRNAFDHSLGEYDFLRGEEEYKKFWTDDLRELQQLVLFKRSPINYLAYLACFKLR
jgi:CelD/BcsL family acetyltransferase involved in cellulose biosynthesis